jgi:hypothetical protein
MVVTDTATTGAGQLKRVPTAVRPTVNAARRMVKAIAPNATEIAYQGNPPRSKSAMWKLVRYSLGDEYVAGIGAFSTYAAIFFYRVASSTTEAACSRAAVRTPASPDSARPPMPSVLP